MAFGKPLSIKIEGIIPMLNQLKNMEKSVIKTVRATLQSELESWIADAKLLTPVDTGALQASGRVLKPRGTRVFKYTLIFGGVIRKGKFVDYAEHIHETHAMGGFLQKVVDARSPSLEARIAKEMSAAINSV